MKEGRLDKQPGKSRGFMLPPGDAQAPPRQVPILGNVQAGSLNTAIENLEGYLPVTTHYASDELFALRVSGESMTGAGIFPNDLVIVRRQASAKTGEIVVALVEDEATIKRLRIRDRRIELHPANPAFEVIVPSRYQCLILGKVIEVRRILERKPILSRMSPVNY